MRLFKPRDVLFVSPEMLSPGTEGALTLEALTERLQAANKSISVVLLPVQPQDEDIEDLGDAVDAYLNKGNCLLSKWKQGRIRQWFIVTGNHIPLGTGFKAQRVYCVDESVGIQESDIAGIEQKLYSTKPFMFDVFD